MASKNREKRMKRRRRRKFKSSFKIGVVVAMFLILAGAYIGYDIYTRAKVADQFGDVGTEKVQEDATFTITEGAASYTVFDAGGGEAILVQREGVDVLIDTGAKESATELCKKIKGKVTGGIDYLVLTSPSEGRIGGIEEIFNNFDVDVCVIGEMGKQEKRVWAQTSKAETIVNGDNLSYDVGDAATLFVIKPEVSSSDPFDRSLVTYFSFGTTGFLALSDAGKEEISRAFGNVSSCNVVVLARNGDPKANEAVPDNSYDYIVAAAGKKSKASGGEITEKLRGDYFVTGIVGDMEFVTNGSDVMLTDQDAKEDILEAIEEAKENAEKEAQKAAAESDNDA